MKRMKERKTRMKVTGKMEVEKERTKERNGCSGCP